jgi:hypothetical protein
MIWKSVSGSLTDSINNIIDRGSNSFVKYSIKLIMFLPFLIRMSIQLLPWIVPGTQ